MSSFEEYQRQQDLFRRAREYGGDLVECECGNTYFEEVPVAQYLQHQPVIIGQQPAPRPGRPAYFMLRCVRCGKLHEPNIMRGARDNMNGDYDAFLDMLEAKDVEDV